MSIALPLSARPCRLAQTAARIVTRFRGVCARSGLARAGYEVVCLPDHVPNLTKRAASGAFLRPLYLQSLFWSEMA